jgi:uncharacterized membrane protein YphA (DoxX/SURF4 family)
MNPWASPRDVTVFIVKLILGGALLWAGLVKINRPYDFLGIVYSYQLVGPRAGIVVAVLLPWLEFVLGVTLLAGFLTTASLYLAVGLGLLFVYVEASALHRTLAISCGCFSLGQGGGTVNYATLTRAVVFFVLAVVGILSARPVGVAANKA